MFKSRTSRFMFEGTMSMSILSMSVVSVLFRLNSFLGLIVAFFAGGFHAGTSILCVENYLCVETLVVVIFPNRISLCVEA